MADKPWQLIGEVSEKLRPENSLLEQNLEYDHITRTGGLCCEYDRVVMYRWAIVVMYRWAIVVLYRWAVVVMYRWAVVVLYRWAVVVMYRWTVL